MINKHLANIVSDHHRDWDGYWILLMLSSHSANDVNTIQILVKNFWNEENPQQESRYIPNAAYRMKDDHVNCEAAGYNYEAFFRCNVEKFSEPVIVSRVPSGIGNR